MKSFLDHLKEEVLPTVQVADGGLDISKPAVRAAINAAIAGVVSQPAVTPYVVFNRLSKLLAQYHIVLPKRFLEGDKGVEVFEVKQFGHKMGMTDSGEFVNEVPSTHYLFLQYGILSPFGITYAKPVVGGMFKVMARLVDKVELDKLMDMAEITMAEEAECMQAIAKANAPKEPMHDIASDEKKKGNKAAVATSQKGLDEDKDPCWKGYEMIGMKKKGGKPVPNCVPVKEEQLDELKKSTLASYIKKAHVSGLEAASQGEIAYARKDKAGLRAANKTGEKREQGIERAASKLAKEEYEKVEAGVKKRSGETHTLHRRNPGHKTEYHTITTERDGRKSVKTGSPKYIKKHWDKLEEASDKDRDLSKLAATAVSKGHPVKKLPAGRAENAVLPKRSMPKGPNIERGRWSGHGRFNEEKGDRITPGTGIPNFTQKNLQDVAKDLGTGQGGATFAMKSNAGTPSRQVNVSTDPAERGNKFTNRAPLDEKAPPGREKQVLALKKKFPKGSESPFAIAWSSYKKSKGE